MPQCPDLGVLVLGSYSQNDLEDPWRTLPKPGVTRKWQVTDSTLPTGISDTVFLLQRYDSQLESQHSARWEEMTDGLLGDSLRTSTWPG